MDYTELSKIAKAVNEFKSPEAQVIVLKHLLNQNQSSDPKQNITEEKSEKSTKNKRSRPTGKPATEPPVAPKTSKKRQSAGPKAVLTGLVEEGYFADRRSMSEIQTYCKDKLARNFKTSDLSPTLSRLIKDHTLTRDKNNETKQYEYFKR